MPLSCLTLHRISLRLFNSQRAEMMCSNEYVFVYGCVSVCVCVCVTEYDKQLWFSNNFNFIERKLEKCVGVWAVRASLWAPKVHHSNESVQTCTYIVQVYNVHSVHIVIIPLTDFKVFDFNYKLRKTAKLYRYLFCAVPKICNLCPWCECAKFIYISNNLPRTL